MSGQETLRRRTALLPTDARPRLLVVVDTEEEFDWGAPFDRGATAVEAMAHQEPAQSLCRRFDLSPTYVVDYPVASQESGYRTLLDWAASGDAIIGAHLHPWVSPPHEEEVNTFNSFPGNLPAELEAAKLKRLGETIEESFGSRPRIYKAGRYGFGPHTAAILEQEGYEVDLSSNPPFDYTDEGGPDYSDYEPHPYWLGTGERLLGIPGTGGYVGWMAGAHSIYALASHRALRWSRLPGILSRLGAIDRLRLSPEGFDAGEMSRLAQALFARGVRVFSLSYHSPSLMPGCTPYVRSAADLDRFLGELESFLDYFFGHLDGVPTTPLALRDELREAA